MKAVELSANPYPWGQGTPCHCGKSSFTPVLSDGTLPEEWEETWCVSTPRGWVRVCRECFQMTFTRPCNSGNRALYA